MWPYFCCYILSCKFWDREVWNVNFVVSACINMNTWLFPGDNVKWSKYIEASAVQTKHRMLTLIVKTGSSHLKLLCIDVECFRHWVHDVQWDECEWVSGSVLIPTVVVFPTSQAYTSFNCRFVRILRTQNRAYVNMVNPSLMHSK